jgi:hypothetical protein
MPTIGTARSIATPAHLARIQRLYFTFLPDGLREGEFRSIKKA